MVHGMGWLNTYCWFVHQNFLKRCAQKHARFWGCRLSKAWAVLRVWREHTETSNKGCQELHRDHNSCGEGMVRKALGPAT